MCENRVLNSALTPRQRMAIYSNASKLCCK